LELIREVNEVDIPLMKGGVAVLTALLVSACTPPTTTSQSKDKDPKQVLEDAVPGSTTGPGMPEVAFMIEEGLYAVPLAVDKDGCEQFTTWSETGVKSLAQPIYFHDGEGAFSPIKVDDASCNASMVKTGVDEDGCPTFRAEQPDGSSSEVVYYPSHHGYTIRKERSNCR
jgi:hypothetical protein